MTAKNKKEEKKALGWKKPRCWDDETRRKLCEDMINYVDENPECIFIQTVARNVGVSPADIHNTAKRYDDVKEAFDYVATVLEERLLIGAMLDRINASFTKFVLSSKHGYVQKSTQTVELKKIESVIDFGERDE